MTRNKKPRAGVQVLGTGKTPRISPSATDNPLQRTPVWRVHQLDIAGPWSCLEGTAKEFEAVLRRLGSFEGMRWYDIIGKDSHSIPVNQLSKAAQDRLCARGLDDLDEIFSLRIDGPGRIIGILDGHCLKILWWDPRHEVCPSKLKHT